MRGIFLTVEGTEGVGKSTNITFIESFIKAQGIELVVTREPGGTPLAEELRGILLANRSENVDHLTELLLIFAARAQHLKTVILPALERGAWVLSDRFTDATYAYQGFGRLLPVNVINTLEQLVQNDVHPDKTIFLDIDVSIGLERASSRGDLDRFEQEDIAFFERVRKGYHDRIQKNVSRYAVIDAEKSLDEVQKQIELVLNNLIAQFK